MMRERELLGKLVEVLKLKGYPKDSILVESPAEAGHENWLAPDLVIVDPKTKEKLAAFEVKVNTSNVIPALAGGVLETYSSTLEEQGIRMYFATSAPAEGSQLELHRVVAGLESPRRVTEEDLPSFSALVAEKFATRKDLARKEQQRTTDAFKTQTTWMGVVAVLLVVADAVFESLLDFQLLTANRLVLLGVAAALFVVPYAARFKGLGVEWERFLGDRRDDS